MEFGVVVEGVLLDVSVEVEFGGFLEGLDGQVLLLVAAVAVADEVVTVLRHQVRTLVVDTLGETVDGVFVAGVTVVGEAGGEVVVPVEEYLVGADDLVEVVGGLLVLVERILGGSHAAHHLQLRGVVVVGDLWGYFQHVLVLALLEINLRQEGRHILAVVGLVLQQEEILQRGLVLTVLIGHIGQIVDGAQLVGPRRLAGLLEQGLGLVVFVGHKV